MNDNTSAQQLVRQGILNIAPYTPGKPIAEVAKEYGLDEIIKLASNENPIGSSPKALAALGDVSNTLFQYPDGKGSALKAALTEHTGYAEEWITLGNGSDEVINMVGSAFLNEGDEVLFSDYSFEVYSIVAKAAGATIVNAATFPGDDQARPLGQDLDALLAAVTDKTKLIFIANPNNPTGNLLLAEPLKAFLSQLPKHVMVLLDEAYYEYVEADGFESGLAWLREFPNLIVTRTFSKLYGLPGLRVGYGIAHPEVTGLLNRIRQPFNVNSMAQAAGVAALTDLEFIEQSLTVNKAGMTWLTGALEQRGLQVIPSYTNFLCIQVPLPGKDLFEALLKRGIIIRDLTSYELPNYVRVTIGTPAQNETFIDSLDAVLAERGLA